MNLPLRIPTPPELPRVFRTLLCGAVAALATAAGAAATATSESAAVEPARFTPYDFEANSGEVVAAELGEIWVPERRGTDGRRIKLQFVRFASTSETPGPPIVYLAGGPGGSGIDTARGRRFPLFMALRRHADVIALDQRGTGMSNSIEPCEPEARYPLEQPLERELLLRLLTAASRECAARWREQGVDLDGYNTLESARDLEDLRLSLGVPKVTLWGISYGTHLAFAMLRTHPESVESAVLASMEGPDETIKLPSRTQSFLEGLEVLKQADPGLERMRRVLERLEKEPIVVETQNPRGGDTVKLGIGRLDVQILTGFLIKNPETQAQIPMLYAALDSGNAAQVAPFFLRLRHYFGETMAGMPEAMEATSSVSPARRARVLAERDQALLGDTLNLPVLPDWSLSKALGVTELPAAFRSPLRSKVPTLFLSGTLDGRTYPASHRELAAGFSRSTFLTIEGAGHDLFMSSPRVEERILDFLARGVTSEKPITVSASPSR
ncbi:MAG: alpha/beta hydrolase [Acidobacteriota bacterium]